MKKAILIPLIVLFVSQNSFAQTTTTSMTGFRRNLATVIFAGLGGAVLGLSTLSFYGEPQDHIGNIWTGLAVGVIGGSAYVLSQNQGSNSMALNPVPQPQGRFARAPMARYVWEF
jgi:hypothetical protein